MRGRASPAGRAGLIKINQLQSAAQAQRLAPRLAMAGVCVGEAAPGVGLAQAAAIRAALPGLPMAVAMPDWRQRSQQQIDALVTELGASHFELTPVDLAKPQELAEELARLQAIRSPKVANGFFVEADDLSFVHEREAYRALQQAGVAWFQFEISSAVAPGFTLSPTALRQVDDLLADLPVLVTDQLQQLAGYPLAAARGFFFNLAVPAAPHSYDFAQETWTESQLMRLLPRRSPA